jgi:hypothetical protein
MRSFVFVGAIDSRLFLHSPPSCVPLSAPHGTWQTFTPEGDPGMDEAYNVPPAVASRPEAPVPAAGAPTAPTANVADEIVSDDPEVRAAVEAAREAQRLKSDPLVVEVVNKPLPLCHDEVRDLVVLSELDLAALSSIVLYDKALTSRTNLVRGCMARARVFVFACAYAGARTHPTHTLRWVRGGGACTTLAS